MSNVTLFLAVSGAMAVLLAVQAWQGMAATDLGGTSALPDLTTPTRMLLAAGHVTSRVIPVMMLLGPLLLTILAVINRRLRNQPSAPNVGLWALVAICAFVVEIGLASVFRGAWLSHAIILVMWMGVAACAIALAESSHLQFLRYLSAKSRWSPALVLVLGVAVAFATPMLAVGVALWPYLLSRGEPAIPQAG